MAKYRRKQPKTQIVDAIKGWRWGRSHRPERTTHEKHFWTIFADEDGVLVEWHSDDFDREYERVEGEEYFDHRDGRYKDLPNKPKPLHCQRCDASVDSFFRYTLGSQDCLCCDCYYALKAERERKPTPLTLADLKPGDVFKWYEDLSPVQVLVSPRRLYSADKNLGTYVPEVRLSQSIIYLRHHDLTPKQLLWVGASDEERKALDDSLKDKWLPRTRGSVASVGECALCKRHTLSFGGLDCEHCIVGEAGERCTTMEAPWGRWCRGTGGRGKLAPNWTPGDPQAYVLTRRVALSLAEFLPDIHPLRIEVEATPVEWPGKTCDSRSK